MGDLGSKRVPANKVYATRAARWGARASQKLSLDEEISAYVEESGEFFA